jgi:hypothetical protein
MSEPVLRDAHVVTHRYGNCHDAKETEDAQGSTRKRLRP